LALFDFQAPLSPDDPCGPDLELEGDADFLNFMATSDGLLPKAFYIRNPKDPDSESKPFNVKDDARGGFDVAVQLSTITSLLQRTRDVRLLTLGAKISILNRDLEQFVDYLQGLESLLDTYWEESNPRGEDGDYSMRYVALQTLDDNAPVVFPLMYTPLFEDRRFGPITYRTALLVEGSVTARDEDEEKLDLAAARRAFDDVDLELLAGRRDKVKALNESLAHIRAIFQDKAGYELVPSFDRLSDTAKKIQLLLDQTLSRRDPSLASDAVTEEQGGDGGGTSSDTVVSAGVNGPIKSFAEAIAALSAVADYYQEKEPSNPALLLVRQARDLVGKPFLDVLRILIPRHLDEAVMKIGRTHAFDLPLERLSDFNTVNGQDESTDKTFAVATREQVLQLLAQVINFFQAAEPTSPIPLLLERARAMASRDFISLLKEILPEDTLRTLN